MAPRSFPAGSSGLQPPGQPRRRVARARSATGGAPRALEAAAAGQVAQPERSPRGRPATSRGAPEPVRARPGLPLARPSGSPSPRRRRRRPPRRLGGGANAPPAPLPRTLSIEPTLFLAKARARPPRPWLARGAGARRRRRTRRTRRVLGGRMPSQAERWPAAASPRRRRTTPSRGCRHAFSIAPARRARGRRRPGASGRARRAATGAAGEGASATVAARPRCSARASVRRAAHFARAGVVGRVIAIVSLVRASAPCGAHARWMSRVAPLHAHGEMSGRRRSCDRGPGPAPGTRSTRGRARAAPCRRKRAVRVSLPTSCTRPARASAPRSPRATGRSRPRRARTSGPRTSRPRLAGRAAPSSGARHAGAGHRVGAVEDLLLGQLGGSADRAAARQREPSRVRAPRGRRAACRAAGRREPRAAAASSPALGARDEQPECARGARAARARPRAVPAGPAPTPWRARASGGPGDRHARAAGGLPVARAEPAATSCRPGPGRHLSRSQCTHSQLRWPPRSRARPRPPPRARPARARPARRTLVRGQRPRPWPPRRPP